MSTTGATGGTSTTAGTSTATTTQNASTTTSEATNLVPDWTATTMTTDVYGMFVGAFFVVLSFIVLFATGSIVSVLVLWATIALVVTVLVYYGFLTVDQLMGSVKKQEKKVEKEVIKPVGPSSGGPLVGSEVFHVSDQAFTYDEAAAVCAAYGTELATLEQVMDAFASGAEWCSYGWSAGGMALYPTQRETWDRLQGEIDYGKRTRCGRPGVNGGYFDPTAKFGVNCYGIKPRGEFNPPAPVPGIDNKQFRDMVNRFKEMLKGFTLDPYSRMEWSEYGNPPPTKKENFTMGGGGMFDMFKQEFFTPYGVRENLENGGGSDYVEPVGQYGLGQGAASLRGPVGLVGDRGEIGPTGPQGAQGLEGRVGPEGKQGPAGPQGLEGRPGAASTVPGPTGPAGRDGAEGSQGPTGMPGRDGQAAQAGRDGATGPTGPRGATGQAGRDGAPGSNATVPRDLQLNSLKIGDFTLAQNGANMLNISNPRFKNTGTDLWLSDNHSSIRFSKGNANGRVGDTWQGGYV